MSERKKHKFNHGSIEDCVCFEFDSGFNIDQICDSLHMTNKGVVDILVKHKRLKYITTI